MVTVLYNFYTPAYKAGGPIQSLVNLVNHLNSPYIRVVCSNRDLDGSLLNVPVNKWVDEKGSSVYYTTGGFGSINKAIAKSDTFFLNGLYSWNFNFLPALCLPGRKIVSVRGMLHPEALLQKTSKKKLYLLLWRLLGLHRRCEYHATSMAEKKYIQAIFGPGVNVWVIPNLPTAIDYQPPPPKGPNEIILTTIALISPMKNHLAVLQALKYCTEKVVYSIYGPIKDLKYWSKCQELIKDLPSNIAVKYYGEIRPAMVVAALAQSHVIIQPSLSENYGHSILEALLAGRPVITSNNTPWNRLSNEHAGINVPHDGIMELKNAISFFAALCTDELEEWSIGARNYAMKAIDVDSIKIQYQQMFELTQ